MTALSSGRTRTRTLRRLRTGLAGAVALAAMSSGAALATTGHPSAAVPDASGPGAAGPDASGPRIRANLDVRDEASAAQQKAQTQAVTKLVNSPGAQRLTSSIGRSAVLDIDPSTGTVRQLANLDGYLTARSAQPAGSIVRGYLNAHHDVLGLTRPDLGTLTLRQDYVDVAGTHHLSFVQRVGGLPVFGNGLTAAVDRSGRLLMIGGSPVSTPADLPPVRAGNKIDSASAAIRASRGFAGDASRAPAVDDTATPVALVDGEHTYRAWQTISTSSSAPSLSVVDAATGRLLVRSSLSSDAAGVAPTTHAPLSTYRSLITADRRQAATHGKHGKHSKQHKHAKKPGTGMVYRYFPEAKRGGDYHRVNFAGKGWIKTSASRLLGNNAHTWSDVKDDNKAEPTEEVHPSKQHTWDRPLHPFKLKNVSFCGHPYPCTWNPNRKYSWQRNRAQNAIQVFYFVNNWHDHLATSPIGFTEAAGNFQTKNTSHKGQGGDAVRAQTDDGANTDHGLPDGNHVDNANFATPPDGRAPTMQMYLQHQPHTSYPDGDPFAPTDVGDEADTVYHEYTHGLSNRLVVDASGHSTLGNIQAGAMGEAWSDWYAMDYLVDQHLQQDRPGKVDVVLFQFDGEGVKLDRTEPLDCAVGSSAARCPGGETGHTGGYTFADYGKVIGQPEVHSDGEIWAQTLWSLRAKIGSKAVESLITRGMELSAANPSFLDMRDAILLADTSVFHGKYHNTIWQVFASRGMGFYAGSLGGNDTHPAADFHTHAVGTGTGTITGTVTDSISGDPIAGAPVTLKFQGGGSEANPTTTTAADGSYSLGPVPVGTYGALSIGGKGYQPVEQSVTVDTDGVTKDATLVRDWAATSGGASIDSFTGPDFGSACGPEQAIDLNQGTVWGSTTGDDDGTPTNQFQPKQITVKLPQPVDISAFGIDPASGCGDGASASVAGYKVETSTDGTTFTQAASGTFTGGDNGTINQVTPTGPQVGIRYVRLTTLSNQTPDFASNCPDGSYSGCSYTDLSEFEVQGSATP